MKRGVSMRGIYKITNKINGKFYIGQSSDIETRYYNHFYELNHNTHCNKHLQNAWNKYGENNFSFEIIYECDKNDDLNNLEKYYITKYNTIDSSIGYNLTTGGEGYNLTNEIKNKISVSKRGQKSKLSIEDVRHIKMAMYCNMQRKEIALLFNTNEKILTTISMGKNFNYILPEINEEIHNLKQKMIDERNAKIILLYDNGKSIKEIIDLGFTRSVVEKCIYKNRSVNRNYNIRKLTKSQEIELVNDYNVLKVSVKTLASKYNISDTTIRSIINSYNNLVF